MKKLLKCFVTVALLLLFIASIFIFPRSNIKNATVVISSDYSTITYEGNVYIPIQLEKLPFEVRNIGMSTVNDMIKATVKDENYFLDKYFFTNYIAVEEYDGETFIYLHTDYDASESDYYCSKNYKEKTVRN